MKLYDHPVKMDRELVLRFRRFSIAMVIGVIICSIFIVAMLVWSKRISSGLKC